MNRFMSWMRKIFWLGLILTLPIFSKSQSASLSGINMADFHQMEADIISKIKDYSIQEQERLDQLKKYLQDWKTWRNSYSNRKTEYVTIPQNLFHLFKKLTLDLNEIERNIKEISNNNAEALDEIKPPTEHHLKQTALSLVDIQYQYDLKSEDIINGTLKGLQLNISLPTETCYFIGQTCYEINNYQCAVDWLKTCSLSLFDDENGQKITKLLYSSYIFLNEPEIAYQYAESCLDYDFFDIPTRHNIFDLGSQLGNLTGGFENLMYANQLCRGEYSKHFDSNLKCRYNHENSPFLKIAPLKEEELHDAPKILFYQDAIYDSEIEFIKNLAADKLHVARLAGHGRPTFSYRVAQAVFMNDQLPSLDRLGKLAEDIIGQRVSSTERCQAINYAPGGFFFTHTDCLNNDDPLGIDNRLTTMLFYLSDVTLGGQTVFPHLGLSVKPTKGAALFWFNIYSDGSCNHFNDHSSCPILIGEKWGFTKFIRSLRNQFCLRSLYENDKKIFEKYPT